MRKFTYAGLWLLLFSPFSLVYAQVNVLTQHNDPSRTGWNNKEIILNTKNVKPGLFAKLFSCPVDDQVFAQPLVVTNVSIPGTGTKNIVYVATVNNSVYAFDADSARTNPYWKVSLTPAGTRPPKNTDMTGACMGNYRDFSGNIGIVGTPVIDKQAGVLYVVSRAVTTSGAVVYTQYLHALDITTGADKPGSPVAIIAQVNGLGDGSSGGILPFDPLHANQRPGLLLLNGVVYIAYAGHCDWSPYHGWLLGYDATTLQQRVVYNTTSQGSGGGTWMCGGGPSADTLGNIYLGTGNGSVGTGPNPADPSNRGESLLKLAPSGNTLAVSDFFTPFNFGTLDASDLDFGATQVMLIPGLNRALEGCKDGHLYLVNTNNLGGYTAGMNKIIQSIDLGTAAHFHASLSYYRGTANEFVYAWPENTALKAFPVNRQADTIDALNVVSSGIQGPSGNSGAVLAISSNGSVDSTAILWASHAINGDANQAVVTGILRAVDANDVTRELWNSRLNPNDNAGNYAKFVCPTVANGKVYLATFSNALQVYGLTNNGVDTCNSPNIGLNKPATASSVRSASNTAAAAFDGNLSTYWASNSTSSEYLYVDLGAKYDLCRTVIHWAINAPVNYNIDISQDANSWTTIQTVRKATGTPLDHTLNLHGSGRYVRMQGLTPGTSGYYAIYEMEIYGTLTVTCFPPSGIAANNISANSATISWQPVGNASGYSLQYKTVNDPTWTTLSSTGTSVTLQALSCGTDYLYQVASSCSTGQQAQSAYSQPAAFSTSACMAGCGPLPTRWTTSDIGNIGVAGNACFNSPTYSLQGSGADIGSNADAFRFAYTTFQSDGDFIARVATQDATDPLNKMGLMIRESLAPDSRNAFIAITSGSGAVFQYRNATGGTTVSTFQNTPTDPVAPYWIKLTKTGSLYEGYSSPDGFSWTRIGNEVDLGFGGAGSGVFAGFAITSHNNGTLSSATADNYSISVPLPVVLQSFTGHIVNDKYISLQWTTASEENSDHFEIERSRDGAHFHTIIVQKSIGNSNRPVNYSAEDSFPGRGLNYYRLKLVDMDGRYAYSPLVLVRFDRGAAPLLFPNPAITFFTVIAGQEPIKEINLFDLSGRKMLRTFNGPAGPVMTVPCAGLPPGIYIVGIRTASQVYLQKLVKMN